MRIFALIMLFSISLYAQNYSDIFQSDLPESLRKNSEMLETQLRVNLEACEKVNPMLAGYYIEYLISKFAKKIDDPDKNYFTTFNKKLESERKRRNDFIDSAGERLLEYSQSEYNIYGVNLIKRLKTSANAENEKFSGQELDINKKYYFACKLLLKDSQMIYSDEISYSDKYAEILKPKVNFVNSLDEIRDNIDAISESKLEEILIRNLYIVKGSGVETGGIKTGKSLFELFRIAGKNELSQRVSLFVTASYYPFNNEINEVLETLVEYRGDTGSLTNEKSIDVTYTISLGLGVRLPLQNKKGMFSYLDLNAGIVQGFKSEINEERIYTNSLPYAVDYSEYYYNSYDYDYYDLLENKEISVTGYYFSMATPLFSQDRIIDVGLSLDVHYISFEYEQYYQRRLSKILPTITKNEYGEHSSSISESSIIIQPGVWASLRFFDFIEINAKYLAPAGMSTSLLFHYEL